jgi:predicted nucleic acid-binding protein
VLIVDTGPLVATADRADSNHADSNHAACRDLLESDEGPLVTTAMVIAEAAYLINRQLGAKAEASLFSSIIEGQIQVADLEVTDWQRIQDLVNTYADLPLGGTDASIVALAERRGGIRIATLDRRHFSVVRPRHTDAFELLP